MTSLAFPTVQACSTSRSTSWIQPSTDPANEPDNPASTLRLVPATGQTPGSPPSAGVAAGPLAPARSPW